MEKSVSNILLGRAGPADGFTLRFGLLTFRLKIKPLTVSQLIAISGELSKIKPIEKDKEFFPALMEGISDAHFIARVIAIATGTRFKRIVTRAITKLDLKDVQTLFSIVVKQSDPAPFFLICLQAGKMNILKAKKVEQ